MKRDDLNEIVNVRKDFAEKSNSVRMDTVVTIILAAVVIAVISLAIVVANIEAVDEPPKGAGWERETVVLGHGDGPGRAVAGSARRKR